MKLTKARIDEFAIHNKQGLYGGGLDAILKDSVASKLLLNIEAINDVGVVGTISGSDILFSEFDPRIAGSDHFRTRRIHKIDTDTYLHGGILNGSTSNNATFVSEDGGATYEKKTMPASGYWYELGASDESGTIVLSLGYENYTYYSTDNGDTWTLCTIPLPGGAGAGDLEIYALDYANGLWVMGLTDFQSYTTPYPRFHIYTSSDGITWASQHTEDQYSGWNYGIYDAKYLLWDGTNWCLSNFVLMEEFGSYNYYAVSFRSTDGITWSRTNVATNWDCTGFHFRSANTRLILGVQDHLWYSDNSGQNWTDSGQISAGTNDLFYFDSGNISATDYTLVASIEEVYYSTNGSSWTACTLPTTYLENNLNFYGLKFFNSKFVVIGALEQTLYNPTTGVPWDLFVARNLIFECSNGTVFAESTEGIDTTNYVELIGLENDGHVHNYRGSSGVLIKGFEGNIADIENSSGYGCVNISYDSIIKNAYRSTIIGGTTNEIEPTGGVYADMTIIGGSNNVLENTGMILRSTTCTGRGIIIGSNNCDNTNSGIVLINCNGVDPAGSGSLTSIISGQGIVFTGSPLYSVILGSYFTTVSSAGARCLAVLGDYDSDITGTSFVYSPALIGSYQCLIDVNASGSHHCFGIYSSEQSDITVASTNADPNHCLVIVGSELSIIDIDTGARDVLGYGIYSSYNCTIDLITGTNYFTGAIIAGDGCSIISADSALILGGEDCGIASGHDHSISSGIGALTRASADWVRGSTGTSPNVSNNTARLTIGGQWRTDVAATTPESDYAELFEWDDGNLNDEDRVGYFVKAIEGTEKIKIYDGEGDILGIVSANPGFIGNAAPLKWKGVYKKDEWGRRQFKDYKLYKFIIDEKIKKVFVDTEGTKWLHYPQPANKEGEKYLGEIPKGISFVNEKHPILSPDYIEQEYIPRDERKEWSPIGLLGQIMVRTAEKITTKYVTVNKKGLAVNYASHGLAQSDSKKYQLLSKGKEYKKGSYGIVKILYKG